MAYLLTIKNLETGEIEKEAECTCIIGGVAEGEGSGVLFAIQGSAYDAGKAMVAVKDAVNYARETIDHLDLATAIAEMGAQRDEAPSEGGADDL